MCPVMGSAGAVVFLLVAALMIVVIVGRYRFNSKTGRARTNPLVRTPAAKGDGRLGANVRQSVPPAPCAAGLRYSEDGIYRMGRPVRIFGGVFAIATAGLVALLATGEAQATWLPVVVMFFSGMLVVGTLISSKPGIRVSDDGIALGQVAYAERHPRPGWSEKMGVAHFVAELPFDRVVEIRLLHGAAVTGARDAIRASAPPRPAAGKKPSPGRKRVLGLFYAGGLPDAMYVRIRSDQTVPVPLVMTASGMGSATTFSTTWSGPEFLIGTKHPLELQQAVRDAVRAYELGGGHPIPVELPNPAPSG